MSDWNEELAIAKAKRRGQIELHPVKGGRNRKKREWQVRCPSFIDGKEWTIYRGLDRAACERWIEKMSRQVYIARYWPAEQVEKAKAEAEARNKKYRIVAPDS